MNTKTSILIASTALFLAVGGWWFANHRKTDTQAASTPVVSTAAAVVEATSPTTEPVSLFNADKPTTAMKAPATRVESKVKAFTAAQGLHRLPEQRFRVDALRDTLLHTSGGCTIHVPASSFVDASGKPVRGPVNVVVQEALNATDLVMGGLCTVYKGKPLESGGSFSITATAMGQELELAEGRALSMSVPSRMKKAGMKLFPGVVRDGQVKWQEPAPLEAPVVEPRVALEALRFDLDTLTTNVTYSVEGFERPADAPIEVTTRVSEVAWADGGLMLKRDSSFMVGEHRVIFYANQQPSSVQVVPVWEGNFARQGGSVAGVNTFLEDPAVNYVFRVKQLGWANIDRLLNDKRTRRVDLVTTIADPSELKDVRISLVMKSHNLYLPGYQRVDGSYGFSHGDYEDMQLPIGAKAVVVATAQRDGKPCFAVHDMIIEPTAQISLEMRPTTDKELRAALNEAL